MPKALTRSQWANLKEVLLHVEIKTRNLAWKEAMDLVEQILAGRNNLAPEIDLKNDCFAVECGLCHKPIGIEEDFVRKGTTAAYIHYDCHHRSTKGLKDLA